MNITAPELELGQLVTLVIYSNADIPRVREESIRVPCNVVQRLYDPDIDKWLYRGEVLNWNAENYDLAISMPLEPVESYVVN